jgi:recombination protein RecR
VENLISALQKLPSVGRKTAERFAVFLLNGDKNLRREIFTAIEKVDENLQLCRECFHFSENELCGICANSNRNRKVLCVVEDSLDLIAIENSGAFDGVFHVLGGTISPLNGVGPDDLKIAELKNRAARGNFNEIILATNPTLEGEATASFVFRAVENLNLKISRPARGLPTGGDLQFFDASTLQKAFSGRVTF